jgi:hypothetical protein
MCFVLSVLCVGRLWRRLRGRFGQWNGADAYARCKLDASRSTCAHARSSLDTFHGYSACTRHSKHWN